jgi:hypothetical protein
VTTDVLLIAITFVVAVIGTLLKDPPAFVKAILILLAILSSVGSLVKSSNDNDDKHFIMAALTATLVPTRSSYEQMFADITRRATAAGFDTTECTSNSDGMTCFLSGGSRKNSALVFNKSEVGEMYARQIGNRSTTPVIKDIFSKRYTPGNADTEFLDKIGILGMSTLFHFYHRNAKGYTYDDSAGVTISMAEDKKITLPADQVFSLPSDTGPNLFSKLEEAYLNVMKRQLGEP